MEGTARKFPETGVCPFLFAGTGEKKTVRGLVHLSSHSVNSHWLLEANSSFCPKGSFPRVVGKAYILDIFPYLGERNYINLVFLETLPSGRASRDFF